MKPELYQQHYDKHHDETACPCQVCGKIFVGKFKLRNHVNKVHEMKKKGNSFMCERCPATFRLMSYLNDHKLSRHKEYYVNESVPEEEEQKIDLTNQNAGIANLTNPNAGNAKKNVKCQFCSVVGLMTPATYQLHYDKHHDKTVFQCDICNKSIVNKYRFRKHKMKRHRKGDEEKSPMLCHLCPLTFMTDSGLSRHKFKFHNDSYVKQMIGCKLCGKQLLKDSLPTHLKYTHRIGKAHPCPKCGKNFQCDFFLKRHVKAVHEKIKSIECNICGKNFPQLQNLQKHINGVHKKLKPYKCKLCGNFFSQTCSLSLHLKNVHKIEKPRVTEADREADVKPELSPSKPTTPASAPATILLPDTYFDEELLNAKRKLKKATKEETWERKHKK